ncbi:unnamed protein product [Trichobilharzia regenti]|nr:unnamed protein product [Trichobilharzia regenti]
MHPSQGTSDKYVNVAPRSGQQEANGIHFAVIEHNPSSRMQSEKQVFSHSPYNNHSRGISQPEKEPLAPGYNNNYRDGRL